MRDHRRAAHAGPVSPWEDAGVERSGTLPNDWYTSRSSSTSRCARFFREVWHCVGRDDQVAEPGQYFTCEVADEQLVVSRGRDGELRALSNVCLHRGRPGRVGCGQRKAFQCPYHGWTFDLDGSMRRAQGMEGTEQFEPRAHAPAASSGSATWGTTVWVALEPDAPSLERVAGRHHAAARQLRRSRDLHVRRRPQLARSSCNWKIYVDNYMEGYHIPFIHPGLAQSLSPSVYTYRLGEYSNEQYGAEPHPRGPGSRVAGILGGTQEFRALKPPLPGLDESEAVGLLLPLGVPAHDDQLHARTGS